MKIKTRLVPLLLVLLLVSSCAAYRIHPGAVNKPDSIAYDSLTIAQAFIEQARAEVTAGTFPEALKTPLNKLIDSYNVARASWLTYRAAMKARTFADVAALNRNITSLSTALNAFRSARSIP